MGRRNPSSPNAGTFRGLYINLDSRPDRLAKLEGEFARFGLTSSYTRIRAYPDPIPARGCYRSHLKALEEAQSIGGIVHILEDDSILSDRLAPFLVSRELEQLLERYDMLHLDMWIDLTVTSRAAFKQAFSTGLIELGTSPVARVACSSSYVVAPRSVGKLKRLWRYHLESGIPIDKLCTNLAAEGKIKVAAVLPFLTSVDLDTGATSDIQKRLPRRYQQTVILQRAEFFVGRSTPLADSA